MFRVYIGLAVILALVCPVHNSMEPEKIEDYSSYEHIRDFLKIFFLSTGNTTSYALRLQSALDSVYFLDYNNVSELCSRHISYISAGLKRGDLWSFFFLDSNGHQASDIINGRERYLGSYKECMAIRKVVSGDDVIEGSYWNLRILTYIFPNKTTLNFFTWHACFPSSCSQGDANIIADTIARANGFEGVYVYVPVLTSPLDDQWFWAAVVILSIFATISVLGTMIDCLDIVQKKKTPEKSQSADQYYTGETIRLIPAERKWLVKDRVSDKLRAVLLCFSLRVNMILTFKPGTEGDIRCLHGLRAVSMFWVILGHCTVFLPEINNTHEIAIKAGMAVVRLFYGATFGVESFFLLSGCLVSYLFLHTTRKLGGLRPGHMVQYYTHRYIRLTPLLATVMVIYTGITPYTVEGPFSKDVSRDSDTCKKSWWKTLLYVNNFGDFFDSCMSWTWYVTNDMQLYIVAPLVIVPLALGYRKTGLLLASMMLFCHLAANTFVIGFYDDWTHDKTKKYLNRIYSKPWTKAGPYAIGLIVGHILFHFNTDLKLRKMVYIPGWTVSTAAALTVVFVQDENFKDHHSLVPALTDRAKNLYEIIKAPLWSLCVGWVIFACHYGYGGCVNSILSWSGWVPLSRLTYSVYLCHLAVINYLNDIIMQEAAYTGMFILQRWISVTVISYLIGLGLTLLIECPIRNLMSWWRTSTGGVDGGGHRDRPSSQCVKE